MSEKLSATVKVRLGTSRTARTRVVEIEFHSKATELTLYKATKKRAKVSSHDISACEFFERTANSSIAIRERDGGAPIACLQFKDNAELYTWVTTLSEILEQVDCPDDVDGPLPSSGTESESSLTSRFRSKSKAILPLSLGDSDERPASPDNNSSAANGGGGDESPSSSSSSSSGGGKKSPKISGKSSSDDSSTKRKKRSFRQSVRLASAFGTSGSGKRSGGNDKDASSSASGSTALASSSSASKVSGGGGSSNNNDDESGEGSHIGSSAATELAEEVSVDWPKLLAWLEVDDVDALRTKLLGESPDAVAATDASRWTPLHHACKSLALKCAEALLLSGADLGARNDTATTPLHYLVEAVKSDEHVAAAQRLVDAALRAAPSASSLLSASNENGDTALHRVVGGSAGGAQALAMARFLLERGAEANASNRLGNSPLLTAVWKGDIDMVRLLLDNGADFTQKDNKGINALKAAQEVGSTELQRLLGRLFEERRVTQLTNIVKEVLSTERDYVRDLEVCIDVFKVGLPKEVHLSEKAVRAIFWNIEHLVEINRALLADLEKIELNADKIGGANIGQIFLRHMPALEAGYIDWCSSQAITSRSLRILESHEFITQWIDLKRTSRKECKSQSLGSFLIKPLQRACRYPLLMRELVKYTLESNADRPRIEQAIGAIQKLVARANEIKRDADTEQEAIELLTPQGVVFTPGSSLVGTGQIAVLGSKADAYFLFTDTLVFTAPSSKGRPKVVETVPFRRQPHVWSLEDFEGGNKHLINAFMIVQPRHGRSQPRRITCYAPSADEKRDCIDMLRAQMSRLLRTTALGAHVLRDDDDSTGTAGSDSASSAASSEEEQRPITSPIAYHELFAPGYVDPSACRTPIYEAVEAGDLSRVKSLVRKPGAPINRTDDSGRTPLVAASMRIKQTGYLEICEELVSRPSCNVDLPTKEGRVALMYMMQGCPPDRFDAFESRVLERLVEKGVKVNVCNHQDRNTPLHYATMAGSTRGVKWLLRFGANPNVINSAGDAPLHLAVKRRLPELVRVLLEHDANPKIVRKSTKKSAYEEAVAQSEKTPELVAVFDKVAEHIRTERGNAAARRARNTNPYVLDELMRRLYLPRYTNPLPNSLLSSTSALQQRLDETVANYDKLLSVAQLLQAVVTRTSGTKVLDIDALLQHETMNGSSSSNAAASSSSSSSSSAASSSSSSTTNASSSQIVRHSSAPVKSGEAPKQISYASLESAEGTRILTAAERRRAFEQHMQSDDSASAPTKRLYIPSTTKATPVDVEAPSADKAIPYAELKTKRDDSVDISALETYLIDSEFEEVLGMERAEFYRLPAWKRSQIKRSAELF
jgi:ankyrin repeat protein